MSQIVPAILTDDKDKFSYFVQKLKEFKCDWVQVDFADNKFVPHKTLLPDDIDAFVLTNLTQKLEAHLMTVEPVQYFMSLYQLGFQRVAMHWEAVSEDVDSVQTAKEYGLEIGLAINPETSIDEVKEAVDIFDYILFLSVTPGKQGGEFIPEVLNKIKEFKNMHPSKEVNIDGGVNATNIEEVAEAGVDKIIIGSGIWYSDDPLSAYNSLEKMID